MEKDDKAEEDNKAKEGPTLADEAPKEDVEKTEQPEEETADLIMKQM